MIMKMFTTTDPQHAPIIIISHIRRSLSSSSSFFTARAVYDLELANVDMMLHTIGLIVDLYRKLDSSPDEACLNLLTRSL